MTDELDDRERPPNPDVTIEILRSMAEAQGLALTDEDLAAILPAVIVGRGPLGTAPDLPPGAEPAVEFRNMR